MSYRIDYGFLHKNKHRRRLPMLTVLSFLLFLFLVNTFWEEGVAYMQASICRLPARIAAALNLLEGDILAGEPLTAAFSDFFQSFHP